MRAMYRWLGERRLMVGLFLFALFVRLVVVLLQSRFAIFDISFEGGDGPLYIALADRMAAGEGFTDAEGSSTAFVTPGYPAFLVPLRLLSESFQLIFLAQAVVGALSVVLLASAARILAGTRAQLATGVIASLYPHSLLWTPQVMTETVYVFAVAALWVLLTRSLLEPKIGSALAAGLVTGAAALVRPPVLGFGVLIALAGLLWRRFRPAALGGLIGILLVMGLWTVRNELQLGSPVVTSTEAGYVLWQGNSPGATGGTRGYVDFEDFQPLSFSAEIDEVRRDDIYLERALTWMRDNPATVASLFPKKLWNMWRPTWAGASTLNSVVTISTYLSLMIFAALGLARTGARPFRGLIFTFVLYHLLLHGLVTGMIRFRLPIEMVLTIPAGIAAADLSQRFFKTRTSRLSPGQP